MFTFRFKRLQIKMQSELFIFDSIHDYDNSFDITKFLVYIKSHFAI